jgi:hypothetical protein
MADNVKVSRVKVESYCRTVGGELNIVVDNVTGPANQPSFTITCSVQDISSTFTGPTKKYCVEQCCAELLTKLPKCDTLKIVDNLTTAHINLLFDALGIFSNIDDYTKVDGTAVLSINSSDDNDLGSRDRGDFSDYLATITRYDKLDPIGYKRIINSLKSVLADKGYIFRLSKEKASEDGRVYHYSVSRVNKCDE